MNLAEAVSFSLQALRANRLRTFLTALGLIIGNASVILVVTISLASKDLILDLIRGVGSNLVYANLESTGENSASVQGDYVKVADVAAIREQLGSRIIAASAVMQIHTQIVISGKIRDVGVDGVDQYYAPVRNIIVRTGRAFDESDITLEDLSLRRPSLDDVFMALTGHSAGADGSDGDEPQPADDAGGGRRGTT